MTTMKRTLKAPGTNYYKATTMYTTTFNVMIILTNRTKQNRTEKNYIIIDNVGL